MRPPCCPKCGGVWFKLKTIWHTTPRFSKTPIGVIDMYYKCDNCGWEWYKQDELLDPKQTNEGEQNAPC